MINETKRFRPNIGAKATRCPRFVETRPEPEESRPAVRGALLFRISVATGGSPRRPGCREGQIGARPPQEINGWSIPAADNHSPKRCADLGISQRIVDLEENCPRNPKGVRCRLSPRTYLESPAAGRLELSSSRTPRPAARRESHRSLEALPMARDKKKFNDSALIWFSSTKVGFCSSRRAAELGDSGDKHRSFGTVTSMTASRHWQPLAFPPGGNIWDSMCVSSKTTSRPFTWLSSFEHSCATSAAMSSCSGTRPKFTRGQSWRPSEKTACACTSNGFPDMLPNSTRRNKFGTTSKGTVPTVFPWTKRTFATLCMPILGVPDDPKPSCVRLFFHQTCRHRLGNLHYLCETQ